MSDIWLLVTLLVLVLKSWNVGASVVSATRRQSPLTTTTKRATGVTRQRSFPQPNMQTPWRSDCNGCSTSMGLLMVAGVMNGMPSKRLVASGLLAVFTFNTVRNLHASEPVRRCAWFWIKAGPIVVHYKFAKRWLRFRGADLETRDRVYESLHEQYSQPALDIAFHLRGLYVKMGQILSSRPDFMPSQYVEKFSKLQDNMPAWETEKVHQLAVSLLRKECPDAFAEYDDLVLDDVALGSASIGQVHRGNLIRKDNGKAKEVAVKVMHMGAEERFRNDFQVFRWLVRLAIPTWSSLLDALQQQVMTEFDYRNEARALKEVRDICRPYRRKVCVPKPMEELCCEHVLVMEMLHGKKLIDSIEGQLCAAIGGSHDRAQEFLRLRKQEIMVGEDCGSQELLRKSVSPMGKLRLLLLFFKCRRIIDLLVDVHGYEIFRAGTWNGDPHFGKKI